MKTRIIKVVDDFELGAIREATAHHCGYFVNNGRVGRLIGFDDAEVIDE